MEAAGEVSEPAGGDASETSRSRPHDVFSLPPVQLLSPRVSKMGNSEATVKFLVGKVA